MTTNTADTISNLFNQLTKALNLTKLANEQDYSDWATGIMICYGVVACSYDDEESSLHDVLANAARKQVTGAVEIAAQWLDKAIEDVTHQVNQKVNQTCGHCGRSDRAFVSDCVNHCVDCDAKLQSAAGCGNSCYPDTHYDNEDS